MPTKPTETRRVEALPAKWRKELDDYQAETDERDMTPEHAAFFNGKLQASYELDAALASGADTPDWRETVTKVCGQVDELRKRYTSADFECEVIIAELDRLLTGPAQED